MRVGPVLFLRRIVGADFPTQLREGESLGSEPGDFVIGDGDQAADAGRTRTDHNNGLQLLLRGVRALRVSDLRTIHIIDGRTGTYRSRLTGAVEEIKPQRIDLVLGVRTGFVIVGQRFFRYRIRHFDSQETAAVLRTVRTARRFFFRTGAERRHGGQAPQ